MKVCENCGIEIDGKDGDNLCHVCEAAEDKKTLARQRAKNRRREHDAIMRDCGLVKVRGALGGTYWE